MDRRRIIRDGLPPLLSEFDDFRCLAVDEFGAPHDTGVDRARLVAVVGDPPEGWFPHGVVVVPLDPARPVWALAEQIRAAAKHRTYGDARADDGQIDARDVAILRAASRGASARQIADELGVGLRTAERYKQSLLRRLGANTQAHALSIAAERGLLHGYAATRATAPN